VISTHNRFVLEMERSLQRQGVSTDKKNKIICAALQDLVGTDILTSVVVILQHGVEVDILDDDNESDIEAREFAIASLSTEERIRYKQEALGIEIDPPEFDEGGLQCGRTRLHVAVMMDDMGSIEDFIADGDDPGEKDNGGNTPFDLALLYGKEQSISVLKHLGANL
jgi:hypothetical protein